MNVKMLHRSLRVVSLCSILLLSSCSLFSGGSGSSVQLPDSIHGPHWDFRKVVEEPAVYRIVRPQDIAANGLPDPLRPPLYLTAVKDCGYSEKDSPLETFRQLLVGMSDIKITTQKTLENQGSSLVFSLVNAKLEGDLLSLASYSTRRETCAIDLVIWASVPASRPDIAPLPDDTLEEFQAYALQTLPTL